MVHVTATIQTYLEEFFDTLQDEVRNSGRKRATPRHFMLALTRDPDLATKFIPNPIIKNSGVVGGIHPALLAPPNMRNKMTAVPG